MTICHGPRSKFCYSSCCYIAKKPVLEEEVEQIGLENIIEKNGCYFLRNKDDFGTCIFLDEEVMLCKISHHMPIYCQLYTCAEHPNFDLFWQEVRHYRKKRGIRPP